MEQDNVQTVTKPNKDPKRVQWGKELGSRNKGRKRVVEESQSNYKELMLIGIAGVGIGALIYFKNRKQEPEPNIEIPPKKEQDLTI